MHDPLALCPPLWVKFRLSSSPHPFNLNTFPAQSFGRQEVGG